MNFVKIMGAIALVLVLVFLGGVLVNLLSADYVASPKLTLDYVYTTVSGEDVVLDTKVTISKVENADYYEIYIDNQRVGKTENTEFKFSNWGDIGACDGIIYVKAVRLDSEGERIASKASNEVFVKKVAG